MKKLNALCLTLCVMLSACSHKPVEVVKNEVPSTLLVCKAEPAKPNLSTGDNTRDFKNGANYVYELKTWGKDCEGKLKSVKRLLDRQ